MAGNDLGDALNRAKKSFRFARVGDHCVTQSDKAEKLANELRHLKQSRKRSNACARGTRSQPSPAHSGAIHVVYDGEGKRRFKYPRKERKRSMPQGYCA